MLARIAAQLEESEHDAVIPLVASRPQPLCAAYRTQPMARRFRESADRGERSPLRALRGARFLEPGEEAFRDLDPELLSFRNVNNRAELAAVRRVADQQGRADGS